MTASGPACQPPGRRERFINFAASLNFSRDEVQSLEDNRVFKQILASSKRQKPDNLVAGAVKWSAINAIKETGTWSMPDDTFAAAFPHRFYVFTRLRLRDGEKTRRGDWKSVRVECLISALGVIVNIRFGLGDLPPEQLTVWPGENEFCLCDENGKNIWHGDITALLVRSARTTLDALDGEWKDLDTSTWPERLNHALYRVYTEIRRVDSGVPDKRLMYGLAVHKPGWDRVTSRQISTTYPAPGMNAGEFFRFAPHGCALVLVAPTDAGWKAANCQRRNVLYALALHQIAIDHQRTLHNELSQGDGVPKPEFDNIQRNDIASRLSQTRYMVMSRVQTGNSWLRYYAQKKGADEWLESLPEANRSRVVAPLVWKELLKQLSEFNRERGSERADGEPDSGNGEKQGVR